MYKTIQSALISRLVIFSKHNEAGQWKHWKCFSVCLSNKVQINQIKDLGFIAFMKFFRHFLKGLLQVLKINCCQTFCDICVQVGVQEVALALLELKGWREREVCPTLEYKVSQDKREIEETQVSWNSGKLEKYSD